MGTVTVSAASLKLNYDDINNAAKDAYFKRVGRPSSVNGGTFAHLLRREKEFIRKYFHDTYTVPAGTDSNAVVLMYLQEMVSWLEAALNANLPGKPDPKILKTITNANHQSCIIFLDSVLQGVYQKETTKPMPSSLRPKFDASSSETDYFTAYISAIGDI